MPKSDAHSMWDGRGIGDYMLTLWYINEAGFRVCLDITQDDYNKVFGNTEAYVCKRVREAAAKGWLIAGLGGAYARLLKRLV